MKFDFKEDIKKAGHTILLYSINALFQGVLGQSLIPLNPQSTQLRRGWYLLFRHCFG